MSTNQNDRLTSSTDQTPEADSSGVSRRKFLGGLGGAAAAAMASGVLGAAALEPAAQAAVTTDLASEAHALSPGDVRRKAARDFRKAMADYWYSKGPGVHPTNGDEDRYPTRIGNYAKSLRHNAFGEVDPDDYNSFLKAIQSGKAADYNSISLASGATRLTNPQCGLAFDMEGLDAQAATVPAPPALASKEIAGEMVELYWMSLLRDTNFLDYGSSPLVAEAIADLSAFGGDFKGPKNRAGQVTLQTLFRDIAPGTATGPYISQFMWLNTPFGAEFVERKTWTLAAGSDHVQTFGDYLSVQQGKAVTKQKFAGERRYVVNGRDLSAWVHVDVLFQAYFNACLILISPPDGSDIGGGLGCPLNAGNPYLNNPTQDGFGTYGAPAIKGLMCEVASRGLKTTWHKKWQVHRRLRPEMFGGRVEVQLNQDKGRYDGILHASLFNAKVLDRIESYNKGSFLLPMAFPEGSPTHPSYTAGHATVAGACVTILKALFNTEDRVIPNPVVPTADGSELVPYTGAPLTIEGELNKLASNIATGRNIAGVHWRSDAYQSMRLGQKIAVSILQEQSLMNHETKPSYIFRGFDGERIVVRDGGVFNTI